MFLLIFVDLSIYQVTQAGLPLIPYFPSSSVFAFSHIFGLGSGSGLHGLYTPICSALLGLEGHHGRLLLFPSSILYQEAVKMYMRI